MRHVCLMAFFTFLLFVLNTRRKKFLLKKLGRVALVFLPCLLLPFTYASLENLLGCLSLPFSILPPPPSPPSLSTCGKCHEPMVFNNWSKVQMIFVTHTSRMHTNNERETRSSTPARLCFSPHNPLFENCETSGIL